MIIIFVSIFSIVLALLHFVVYKTIISILSLSFTWRLVTLIILAVFCFSFILSIVLNFNFNNLFTRIYYTISATWLGFAFYFLLASVLYAVTLLLFRIFDISISLQWFGVLCFILAIIVGIYGVIHANYIYTKNVNIALPNLPSSWHNRRAVFISDIHLGAIYGQNFSAEIVAKINQINPDIIFIGGDLYDGAKVDEFEIIKPFAGLHSKLGTYFITGNHEEFRSNEKYLESVRKIGMKVLYNQMVNIEGLQLIGVDDRDSINTDKFKNILSSLNIDKNKPSILLKHQPFQLNIAAQAGISLQISGHTHKAQVFPLTLLTKFIYNGFDYGLHYWDKMAVFTSSGVGSWGPPLRVGTDSEIVVITFLPK